MTDDGTGLLTIGRLARATGLTVRTIRYRELLGRVKGSGAGSAHREEFGWVVAALRTRTGG